MSEHLDHDDTTDHIVDQLGRYAHAAESQIPTTPQHSPRRSPRPFLAAAAVVVLIAGGLGVVALVRDGDRVDAVRSTEQDEPADDGSTDDATTVPATTTLPGAAAELGTAARPDSLPSGAPCVDAADDQPEIDGMRIAFVPEGFVPTGPAERVLGDPLDTSTSESSRLTLTRPDGASIVVTNFWSDAPDATVESIVSAQSAYHVSLLRCRIEADGERHPDHLVGVRVAETAEGVVVVGQDWGHGGFIVRGSSGLTREEILTVASGLR